jgi:hypothetical protein
VGFFSLWFAGGFSLTNQLSQKRFEHGVDYADCDTNPPVFAIDRLLRVALIFPLLMERAHIVSNGLGSLKKFTERFRARLRGRAAHCVVGEDSLTAE